ncbi:MAG: cation-translocating P-type ATPase [Defluviitaleaceae bacterium]|nr:cation-translocating P-type ATPase [Defluviitaleaceae bacterium]
MSTGPNVHTPAYGLTSAEAASRLREYGPNELTPHKKEGPLHTILGVVKEPMFILLFVAAAVYFFLGERRDGAILLVFVIVMSAIEIAQEIKTGNTLNALKNLSAPHISVLRDGMETVIDSRELVPGDVMFISEGVKIPADGRVVKASDLRVDESTLTGEPEGMWKEEGGACFGGTLVLQGSASVLVEKTGPLTEYGKIGAHIESAPDFPTPLQKQTNGLVRTCGIIAAILFVLVCVITYLNSSVAAAGQRLTSSALSGISLAMATIPEEFPVIMTVFLSMGAWRLARRSSLVRRLPSVETLGAVSVLCVDKTGTITMNKMRVSEVWACEGGEAHMIENMGLACEIEAYDPMEKAMLDFCEERGIPKAHIFGGNMITEYPFTNELKMMGHVWRHEGEVVITAKGSAESLFKLCRMPEAERAEAEKTYREMSEKGLRVIAVGEQHLAGEGGIPKEITGCELTLNGLVGLYDPPRETVKADIARCARAGVRVVMITGDNGVTAAAIARQVGILGGKAGDDEVVSGAELAKMNGGELKAAIKKASVFSRVLPEHKMMIVKAFRECGEVVAMTGDGVNDAPALKYADIGIAMGQRGSEVSREAADLILMDDNFTTIVETIKDGRRIFDNIRKAMGYVLTIHIPIALAALLAPLLKIGTADLLFLPIHIVLMELIIDPTCSIVLERQPAEGDIMDRPPRDSKEKILSRQVLIKSLIQGLAVFAAAFGLYYFEVRCGSPAKGRAMGIMMIMLANLFLVNVNSSEIDSVVSSVKRLARDKIMWAAVIVTIAAVIVLVYTPVNTYARLTALSWQETLVTVGCAVAAVFWFEIVKAWRRGRRKKK